MRGLEGLGKLRRENNRKINNENSGLGGVVEGRAAQEGG